MKLFVIVICVFISAQLSAQTRHRTLAVKRKIPASSAAAAGKLVYMNYCVTCHQADAGGVPRMNPPLIKTDYVLGDKTRLIKIVLNGFNEDVAINGQKYSNSMPSHDFLKDQQIADVLTYVRNNFGNKAPAVKLSEVSKLRLANKK